MRACPDRRSHPHGIFQGTLSARFSASPTKKGIHYADVRNLGENEVYRIIYSDKHQEEVMFEAPDYGRVHIVV